MAFGGGGWRPNNRRSRRQGGSAPRSTQKGADRTFILILVLFTVAVVGLLVVLFNFAY